MSEKYSRPAQPPPTYNQPGGEQSPFNEPYYPQQGVNSSDYHQQQQPDYDPESQFPPEKIVGSGKPDNGETFDDSFKVKNKLNDWPFTILFIATVAGFIVVAGIVLSAWASNYSTSGSGIYDSGASFTLNTNTVVLFAFVIVISLVLAVLMLCFARIAPKRFIQVGIVLNVVLGLASSIYYLAVGYYSAGIVFLVFTLISAYCYWSMRGRIPFSATVLTIVIDVMKRNPSTLVTSLVGIIVSGAFAALFSATVVATYMKWTPSDENGNCSFNEGSTSCSRSKVIGILVFVFFAGYYITEVIGNVIHVTISGVYGSWYYLSRSDQGMPRFPALGAFKRAMTWSFGSICFGSLIVALLQLLKTVIQILKNDALQNGDGWQAAILCCADCILGLIEWAVRYFNHYAYSFVALYGESYMKSARATWDLFRAKGLDALVNDCLIGAGLSFFALFVSYLSALFSYLYLRYTAPGYNSDGSFYAPVVAFTFVIALQIVNIASSVIRSGTATFFVCLARDPEVFQISYPDEFSRIFADYPQVMNKVAARR
ncbi:BA75_05125T0 [Komagataella pastoris]|uniref:Protein PNS1 n=1 Tax=Komagataella pastoris TaxID=4922 RepID=A0A1B2JI91_PICPA|nr:BA75_05125T0 [Komagataella pastoris]